MSLFADLPTMLIYHACYVSHPQLVSIQQRFGDLNQALQLSLNDWRQADILAETQYSQLNSTETATKVKESLEWAEQDDQAWLIYGDKNYPQKLLDIDEPPILLAVRGNASLLTDPQIAIVGSRHASKQGVETAKDFAKFLSSQGITITSGLALGIDRAAHQGGLLGVGKTVAVVATGLDRIYPASNQQLGHEIVEQGVMVSEFPLGTKPLNFNFPKRNRIISGLSVGTLVIEAALKSGSLITARLASEQGREVFAVPGSIHNPQTKGCHQLIKQGAKLVESGQDILEELMQILEPFVQQNLQELGQTVEQVKASASVQHPLFEWIGYDAISLDELVVLSKMPVSSLQAELIMLELNGELEALSAARWRRIK